MPSLTRPIVVPVYEAVNDQPAGVSFYIPGTTAPFATITLSDVFATLGFTGTPNPNACAFFGDDLFVTSAPENDGTDNAIVKFPGFLIDPTTSINGATILDHPSSSTDTFIGMAFDGLGNLYVADYAYIWQYAAAQVTAGSATQKNLVLNNPNSFFANLVFDGSGNLWATDNNAGVVVIAKPQDIEFDSSGNPTTTVGHFAVTLDGQVAVANAAGSSSGLLQPNTNFFNEPEGIDIDNDGNIWVANNNDDGTMGALSAIVKLSSTLVNSAASYAANPSGAAPTIVPNANGFVYQFPTNRPSYTTPEFGGLQVDSANNCLYVNEEDSGFVWQIPLPIPPIDENTYNQSMFELTDMQVSGIGNGGIALAYPLLLIKDYPSDSGQEPDTGATQLYESQDILPGTSGVVTYSASGIPVTVNITNRGAAPTLLSDESILRLYWASASTGLSWPEPWDGTVFSPTDEPLGGEIIDATTMAPYKIPALSAGETHTASILWATMPIPALYNNSEHFCLLARIETKSAYPFGMDYWEEDMTGQYTDQAYLKHNVEYNSKIAWRNITIVPSSGISPIFGGGRPHLPFRFPILIANFGQADSHARLGFELLNADGRPVKLGSSQVVIHAEDSVLRRIEEMKVSEEIIAYLGEGRFLIVDIERGIEALRIHSRESLPLTVEFTPENPEESFALRVMQHSVQGLESRLIGGQTFVYGHVTGLSPAKA